MADELTLRLYQDGGVPSDDEILRNLRACAHLDRYEIPDHYYERWKEQALNGGKTLDDFLTKTLPDMASDYLALNSDGLVTVCEGRWNDWQMVARSFSPLVLGTMLLWKEGRSIGGNFRFTALPVSSQADGEICDDHLHLNHSAEADVTWINMLSQPNAYIRVHRQRDKDELFRSQPYIRSYAQLYQLLKQAKDLLREITNCSVKRVPVTLTLRVEADILIHSLRIIRNGCDSHFSHALHHYLLIKGAIRRFLVVQAHQYGLVQFSYTLHEPFRGPERFHNGQRLAQMVGGTLRGKTHLELRLCANEIKHIPAIRHGLRVLNGITGCEASASFVGHFIKKQKGIRKDIKKDKSIIVRDMHYLSGIDTAGKDTAAEPEAFAESYHELREKGIRHFTYHAGEDFFHILDGLRIIYEAVTKLGLQPGDRIGHASAAGVSPQLWAQNLDGVVPVKENDYRKALDFVKKMIYEDYLSLPKETSDKIEKAQRLYKLESDRLCTIDCFETLSASDIVSVQQALLHFLDDRGIAIEATPTSNVTIGHCHDFKAYHLSTWLRWKHIDHRHVPHIVLGADETGVFPTNIHNEYANLRDMLANDTLLSPLADLIINDIMEDSRDYCFRQNAII